MSLKKETVELFKKLGIDVAALTTAITATDEVDFIVPEGQVLTDAQLTERDTVKKTEGKTEGETTTRVAFQKEIAKALGVTPKGDRVGDLVASVKEELAKGADEKLKLATDQVTALTADKDSLSKQLIEKDGVIEKTSFENELIGYFPSDRGKDLTDKERLMLINGDISFEKIDGKTVAKKGTEIIKDAATHAPLSIDKVIANAFTEKPFLLGTPTGGGDGGRGGKTETGAGASSGFKKMSEFKADWKAKNPNANSEGHEFLADVGKHAAEVKDFDYYE